jgi:diguanylate cyclase (GGDEF)-like protein
VPELSIALRMGTYLLWTIHFSLLLRTEQLASRQALTDMQNRTVQSTTSHAGSRGIKDRQMLRNAKTDPLTGVYNRISIMDIIDDRIKSKRDKPFAVLMFDIDKLKQMNEQYGRGIGDSALTHVAKETSAALRREDRLGRYGEDEFILMMPNVDLPTVEIIAERLRTRIQETSNPAYTISIGIALYPKDGITVLQLIKQAELGLYASKSKGGNKVSHKPIF